MVAYRVTEFDIIEFAKFILTFVAFVGTLSSFFYFFCFLNVCCSLQTSVNCHPLNRGKMHEKPNKWACVRYPHLVLDRRSQSPVSTYIKTDSRYKFGTYLEIDIPDCEALSRTRTRLKFPTILHNVDIFGPRLNASLCFSNPVSLLTEVFTERFTHFFFLLWFAPSSPLSAEVIFIGFFVVALFCRLSWHTDTQTQGKRMNERKKEMANEIRTMQTNLNKLRNASRRSSK